MGEWPAGTSPARKEAVKWYRKAAEQGHVKAQFNLGVMYANGQVVIDIPPVLSWMYSRQVVTPDYKEAVKWYRKAAEQGHGDASNVLGWMYYKGHGVIQDYIQAHKWMDISASLGRGGAKERDTIAKKMTKEQIAEAQKLRSSPVNGRPSKTSTVFLH